MTAPQSHREPRPVFLGRVWMNGDPFLVVDRRHAETWTGFQGDYERVLALSARDVEIGVGGGHGLVLSGEYDDGTLEVFRVQGDELLFIGVRYAESIDYGRFLSDAITLEGTRKASLEVESGEIAVLAAARPWAGGSLVREGSGPLPTDWGQPSEDILLVAVPPGTYALLGQVADRDQYGLAVWRLEHVA